MKWYLLVWQRFADFHGRSPRREFWTFTLVNTVVLLILYLAGTGFSMAEESAAGGIAYILSVAYFLVVFIPTLACSVRRLHDTNRSGWWILISLIAVIGDVALLVLLAIEGTHGRNPYGPDPRLSRHATAIG